MFTQGIEKLTDIKKIIDEAESIAILSHEDPDGDAIGSALALFNYLNMYFHDKDVLKPIQIALRKMPKYFIELPGYKEVKEDIEGEVDLLIVVDLNEKGRLGELEYVVDKAKKILVIDHHLGEGDFGDYKIINSDAASTTIVLVDIYKELSNEYEIIKPSKKIMELALIGVLTDTSGFKNPNTNQEVYQFAIDILEEGVSIADTMRDVLGKVSKNALALIRIALTRLEFYHGDRVAFSYLLFSDDEYKNREHGEHDGISNLMRDLDCVDIAILVREVEEGFKLGIRSEREYDCRKIAEVFNGGGHKNAAGATIYTKDLDRIKLETVREAIKVIDEYDSVK